VGLKRQKNLSVACRGGGLRSLCGYFQGCVGAPAAFEALPQAPFNCFTALRGTAHGTSFDFMSVLRSIARQGASSKPLSQCSRSRFALHERWRRSCCGAGRGRAGILCSTVRFGFAKRPTVWVGPVGPAGDKVCDAGKAFPFDFYRRGAAAARRELDRCGKPASRSLRGRRTADVGRTSSAAKTTGSKKPRGNAPKLIGRRLALQRR
jgi:hypothetical protein